MIDKHIEQRHRATFDAIWHVDASGNEFWRARELASELEYSEYRHFLPVIERAREVCRGSGRKVADHFEDILEMVEIGSGAHREIEVVTPLPAPERSIGQIASAKKKLGKDK